MSNKMAIVLGDSFNNTLGLIRSLGEAGAKVVLILVGKDRLFVSHSKYLNRTIKIESLDQCQPILISLGNSEEKPFLICSNDKAAKWVDDNEVWLSRQFLTPMRGKKLGTMFDKPAQCREAEAFGITIPQSVVYHRGAEIPKNLHFPVLLKPANSNSGEKSDIHICKEIKEICSAMEQQSSCNDFIIQEYIEKDFEINMIGVATDRGVVIPGGIKKMRHYPKSYSPCSYGLFLSADKLNFDTRPIADMIQSIGYHGPFSVEFLRMGNQSYFMEVNFRHDGLAYTATAAGINLLKMYLNDSVGQYRVKPTYMMDLSIDFCHVKDGSISRNRWIKDFLRTGCQLNFNLRDPMPTIAYYKSKLLK